MELGSLLKERISCQVKREKKITFGVMKILLIVFLLQCCIIAVSAVPINFGDAVSSTIAPAGIDTYTFSAAAGDTIYIRMSTTNLTYPQFQVLAPNHTIIADMHYSINTVETLLHLDSTGEYTIFAGDDDSLHTGTYTLYLQRINTPVNAPVLPYGTTTNGSINQMAEFKTYKFSATAGDTTYIRMSTTNLTYPEFRVYAPNGTLIADFHYSINTVETLLHLDKTGEYTVFAGSDTGLGVGTYTLFFQRINTPVNAPVLPYGTTTNGSINQMAEFKTYTFSATAGDTTYIRMSTTNLTHHAFRVYAPNGTLLADMHNSINSVETLLHLDSTGEYTVFAGNADGIYTGTYTLFLQRINNPVNASVLPFGTTTNGSINQMAEYKTYTFSATAGDTTFIRMSTTNLTHPEFRVYAPNGTLIADFHYSINTVETLLHLDKTGEYTVFAGNADGIYTGTYTLYIQRISNPVSSRIGVFRNSTHMFYLDYNGNGVWNGASVDRSYNFGITGDIPITGDWNSDGISEIGVFRPSTHLFYLDYNGNGVWNGASVDKSYNFGISGDIPISGDWNSDEISEIGVFRPSTHLFYLDYNGNGVWNGAAVDKTYNFGITGDLPISGGWN